MPKECRKCKKIIPNRIKIDGKTKNLGNRKFCLECSPFGENNRSRKDPLSLSKTSNFMKNYSNWSVERKKIHIIRVLKKKYERKIKLIEMAGGKCQKCGYNKCLRSLHFHHREPAEKLFELNINTLGGSWERIFTEFNKCDLVCSNCHGEIEEELSNVKFNDFDKILDEEIKSGVIKK